MIIKKKKKKRFPMIITEFVCGLDDDDYHS